MSYTKDEAALIYLSGCSGLDWRECQKLLSLAASPWELFENFETFLAKGLNARMREFPKSTFLERKDELDRELERLNRKNYFAVTILSRDYPQQLAAIDSAPLVLFGAGNRNLLQEKIFCIVGSRKTPAYAQAFGTKVAEELCDYFTIVTGLAEGGDIAALKGALKKDRAICVLPCGLNECYPAAHASIKERVIREGLVLSENPLDAKNRKYAFHARNRILAGISCGTLVLSAGEKSGTLITANYCADFGRDLFALPYSVGVEQGVGCNRLLKQGAFLCTGTQDILDCYGILMKEKPSFEELTEEEILVLKTLTEGEELHASLIAQRAKLQIFEATALLAGLEMKGIVVKSGANCYKMIG